MWTCLVSGPDCAHVLSCVMFSCYNLRPCNLVTLGKCERMRDCRLHALAGSPARSQQGAHRDIEAGQPQVNPSQQAEQRNRPGVDRVASGGPSSIGSTERAASAGEGPSNKLPGFQRFSSASGDAASPSVPNSRISIDAPSSGSQAIPGRQRQKKSRLASALDRELVVFERGQDGLHIRRGRDVQDGAGPEEIRECRICLSADEQSKIISACKCSGTQRWTHYG